MNDDSILSKVDQDDGKPAKKISSEQNKVEEQTNSVDDPDDLIQSSETASKDGELNSMLLSEQFGKGYKDSSSLLQIQGAILSMKD